MNFFSNYYRLVGQEASYYYPQDLHRLVALHPELNISELLSYPNIKIFEEGFRDLYNGTPITLGSDELGFSAGFEICQCILSILPDGGVVPVHLSPGFIYQLAPLAKRHLHVLRSAQRNIVLGHRADLMAEVLNRHIGLSRPRCVHMNIKSEITQGALAHQVLIYNQAEQVDVLIRYAGNYMSPNHFSWLKRV